MGQEEAIVIEWRGGGESNAKQSKYAVVYTTHNGHWCGRKQKPLFRYDSQIDDTIRSENLISIWRNLEHSTLFLVWTHLWTTYFFVHSVWKFNQHINYCQHFNNVDHLNASDNCSSISRYRNHCHTLWVNQEKKTKQNETKGNKTKWKTKKLGWIVLLKTKLS